MALLSVQPLPTAKATTKLHFVLLRGKPGERTTQQVVEGFLNNFGPEPVRHLQHVEQLQASKGAPTTVVVSVLAAKSTVSASEWASISKCSTISALKAALASEAPNLVYEDLFKLNVQDQKVTFLARIRQSALSTWLQAEGLPCTVVPLGDSIEQFRVLWDKGVSTLSELHQKYKALRGFSGAVQTPKGLGARFRQADYDSARQATGLDMGESWVLRGIPVDMPLQHIDSLLADMKWKAVVQPESRRARGRTAQVRVRATAEPPAFLYRVATGSEAYTIHVSKPLPRTRVQKSEEISPPETWAQAAKRALGKELGQPAPTPVATQVEPLNMPSFEQYPEANDMDMTGDQAETDDDAEYSDDAYVEAQLPIAEPVSVKKRKTEKKVQNSAARESC